MVSVLPSAMLIDCLTSYGDPLADHMTEEVMSVSIIVAVALPSLVVKLRIKHPATISFSSH